MGLARLLLACQHVGTDALTRTGTVVVHLQGGLWLTDQCCCFHWTRNVSPFRVQGTHQITLFIVLKFRIGGCRLRELAEIGLVLAIASDRHFLRRGRRSLLVCIPQLGGSSFHLLLQQALLTLSELLLQLYLL